MDNKGAVLLGIATPEELAVFIAQAEKEAEKSEDEFIPGYL